MSLETALAENTAAMTAMKTVMEQMVANQERLLAGQAAAIEKIDAGKGSSATTTRRSRAAKAEEAATPATDTPNTSDEPADTASGAEDAASASDEPAAAAAVSFADYAKAWLGGAESGSDEYKRRGKRLMGILANYGAAKMSELDEKHHAAALFYIKRDEAGKEVKFDVEYDFAGDPAQDEPAGEDFGGAFD